MPGRDQEPSFQLASGTTNERDGSYNLQNGPVGSIFYNTDTSNVEVYHEDPSNNLGWRDLVMNNRVGMDLSGVDNITFSDGTSQATTAAITQEYVKIADYASVRYPFINNTDDTPSILGATGSVSILVSSSTQHRFNTSTGKYTVLNDGIFLVSIAVRGADTTDTGARQRVSICKNDVQPSFVLSYMPTDNGGRHFYELSQLFVCSADDTLSAYLVDNYPNDSAANTIHLFEMFIVKIY